MKFIDLYKDYVNKKGTVCPALKGFNAEIPDRGLVFLLGKSGCGKSTLLNIVGGIDTPTSGSILIGDRDIAKLTEEERDRYRANNVGFIFQNFNLFEQLNVFENVVFGISEVNDEIREKVELLLKKLDILECKQKNINELSGGQQQRAAIARALMKDCKILLADEPSGNLDEANGTLIFDTLKEISKDRLVLVVTHDRDNAYFYGDVVVEMQDGKAVGVEKPTEKTIEEDAGIELALEDRKKKFSAKTTFKLSFSFMIRKKLKMIFSVLLLAVSLGVTGVTFMCYQYDFGAISADILAGDEMDYMEISRHYVDPVTKKFDMTRQRRAFDEKFADKIIEKYDLTGVDYAYTIFGLTISKNAPVQQYLQNNITTAMVTNPENLKKYGFETMRGSYPDAAGEVAISDFLADSIAVQAPLYIAKRLKVLSTDLLRDDAALEAALKNLDAETLSALFSENWEQEIAQPETLKRVREHLGMVLLNSTVDFGAGAYKITAIFESGYKEKYGHILNAKYDNMNAEIRDFQQLAMNYLNALFVGESFIDAPFNGDSIYVGGRTDVKFSAFENPSSLPAPKEDEVLMSTTLFQQLFKESFDASKTYTFNNGIKLRYAADSSLYDTIYEGRELKVVGVFDESDDPSVVVYHDATFEDCRNHCVFKSRISFDMPKSRTILIGLINEMKTQEVSYNSTNAYFTYNLADIMDIFKTVFLIVSLALAAFSAILMYNYFSMMIQNQKKEIGIMRALGTSNGQISKLYLLCGVLVVGVTVALSWIVLSVMGAAIDGVLAKEFIRFADAKIKSELHILNFSVLPYLIILATGLAIAVLSTVVPISKIKKMSPINAIRNE